MFIVCSRRPENPLFSARVAPLQPCVNLLPCSGVGLNVLIVDDSSAVRAFVRAALEDADFARIHEAATGFEALRILAANAFDVVIVDVNMPDINGLELLSFMAKSPRQQGARKILISTQVGGSDAKRGTDLGADAFLQKPFEVDQLKTLIEEVLAKADGASND